LDILPPWLGEGSRRPALMDRCTSGRDLPDRVAGNRGAMWRSGSIGPDDSRLCHRRGARTDRWRCALSDGGAVSPTDFQHGGHEGHKAFQRDPGQRPDRVHGEVWSIQTLRAKRNIAFSPWNAVDSVLRGRWSIVEKAVVDTSRPHPSGASAAGIVRLRRGKEDCHPETIPPLTPAVRLPTMKILPELRATVRTHLAPRS
jgi:hypothetical protein